MKSYLSLIPASAKVHREENRKTILCIVFAVFMVTAIFSMAEMGSRMELSRLTTKHAGLTLADILESSSMQVVLPPAIILFLLVLVSDILMISGSINSSVAQRTRFFGMMRCIGMSKRQVRHYVRLEALNWCKTAIPMGLALGMIVTWMLCAVLRFCVGEEFTDIPLFGISFLGIISGILVGLTAVLFAAGAPARRASKISPVVAVAGNDDGSRVGIRPMKIGRGRIETSLGMGHARQARKNRTLLTGSFALSIILFLSFSVLIDVVNYVMPQSAAASDLDIFSDEEEKIPAQMVENIRKVDGVKEVYGRRSVFQVSAVLEGAAASAVDLISYDDFDLKCLKKNGVLKWGSNLSKVCGDSQYVLATSDPYSTWSIGDVIYVGSEKLTIAGLLKYDPFSADGLTHGEITLITSGETFIRLTGDSDYDLVMVQLTGNATDETVEEIQRIAGDQYTVEDKRDQKTSGTYMAFVGCVYGFLLIIALVTMLSMVNNISMSVSARTKEYGIMRAVGMDKDQIRRMIAAETFRYAVSGLVTGCVVGLLFSKMLYSFLITSHYPYAVWQLPVARLIVVIVFLLLTVTVAMREPVKRICEMPVTEIIKAY